MPTKNASITRTARQDPADPPNADAEDEDAVRKMETRLQNADFFLRGFKMIKLAEKEELEEVESPSRSRSGVQTARR